MAFRQLQMWLVGVCFCTQIAHAAPDFEFGNNPGPFPVGIRAVQQLDQTRVFKPTIDIQSGARTQGERARPLQMLVWYPAQSSGSPLRYGDYLRWNVTEDDFSLSQTELDRRHQTLKGQWAGATAPQHAVTAELQRPLWASHHAPLAHGKFPLVIYAASFGASATENIELCEYLASHGYVVIAVPSMGAHSHEMTADIAGAEAQVADIGLALAYAHQLPEVDSMRIATVGFSWGGLTNAMASAKDDRIQAVVSLDGALKYYPHMFASGKQAPHYMTAERMTAPLLFINRPQASPHSENPAMPPAMEFVNAMLYADVYRLTLHQTQHTDFASGYLHRQSANGEAASTLRHSSLAYTWMTRYVLNFLNAKLKHSPTAANFIAAPPATNGAPQGLADMQTTPALSVAPTVQAIAEQLYRLGFDHAQTLVRDIQRADPKAAPSDIALNHWGYNLLKADRVADAIEVFKMAVAFFPEDANAYDSLAEAYAAHKAPALALANYKKALALAPSNGDIQKAITQLEATLAKPN